MGRLVLDILSSVPQRRIFSHLLMNRTFIIWFIGVVLIGICIMSAASGLHRPSVIVNMPADAKPLSQLTQPTDKVIGSERAVLWWTIYQATLTGPYGSPSAAADSADRAVRSAYGAAPTH